MNITTNKQKVLRKDVSSGTMLPKEELLRIVKNKNGNIFVDKTGKAEGRGVYILPTRNAFEKVKKSNALSRGLKTKILEDFYLELEKEINNG